MPFRMDPLPPREPRRDRIFSAVPDGLPCPPPSEDDRCPVPAVPFPLPLVDPPSLGDPLANLMNPLLTHD